jgi:hypothetical protein
MTEKKRIVGNGIGIGAALGVAFGAAYGYKSGNIFPEALPWDLR